MSFTSTVKEEITRLENNKLEYIAELSAILRNNANVDNDIVITIENNAVARRIFKLLKTIYDITPNITIRKRYNFNNNYSYILKQMREGKLKRVLIVPTGALFSPTMYFQKESLPAIAHAVSLEVVQKWFIYMPFYSVVLLAWFPN